MPRKRRWPIRFTRFGTYYILFSLGVGAAAINTGNNLLYLMLGLLLGFIIISGFLSDSCLWGFKLDVQNVGDFYAGRPAEFEFTGSKSWFPGMILRLQAIWDYATTQHLFYWIPRYGRRSIRGQMTPQDRGWLRLRSWKSSTKFPFGLFEKFRVQESQLQWIVFPRVESIPLRMLQAAGMKAADAPTNRKGQGAVPFDLRDYQQGDSSKRIHWKASARRGQWMVAEMEEETTAGERLHVVAWPSRAEQEAFISFLASWVSTLYHLGRPFGLSTPGAVFVPEHSKTQLKKILTYLALVQPDQELPLATVQQSGARSLDAFRLWKSMKGAA